jgi:hypothetical protein
MEPVSVLYDRPSWIPDGLNSGSLPASSETAVSDLLGRGTPLRANPHQHAAEQTAERVCVGLGLLRAPDYVREDRAAIGSLTALCYPDASADRLLIILLAMLSLFMVDDALDNYQRKNKDLSDVLIEWNTALGGRFSDGVAPVDCTPYGKLLFEICRRLNRGLCSDTWINRFRHSVSQYLAHSFRAAIRWQGKEEPVHWAMYAQERFHDVAVNPVLDLIEFSHEFELTEEEWCHESFQRARSCTIFHLALVNDVYSHEKEVVSRANPNNVIPVLERQLGIGTREAVSRAIGLANDCYLEFEKNAGYWAAEPCSPRVLTVINSMRTWMAASLAWHPRSTRYASDRPPVWLNHDKASDPG